MKTYLLLDLQRIHGRGKLAEDLIRLLVELKLSGDQVGQVAQGLRGIKDLADESTQQETPQIQKINQRESKNSRSSSRSRPPQSDQRTHPQPARSRHGHLH